MWARALAAVLATALLLTLVDLALALTDARTGVVDVEPLGAGAAVLGLHVLVGLALWPVVTASGVVVRRFGSRPHAVLGLVALATVVLGGVNAGLLAARPVLVGAALAAFAISLAGLLFGLRRRRLRMAAVAVAVLGAVGLGVANGRTFVGLNPAQHQALALAAWIVAVPGLFVALARLERELRGRGRQAALLVALGTTAALVFGLRMSALTDESRSTRFFVRQAAPQCAATLDGLTPVLDADGDGHAAGFGGGDCAPLDPEVHPDALESPGDGIDQNCMAGDPQPADIEAFGARLRGTQTDGTPVDQILLITVDALRGDQQLPRTAAALSGRCRDFEVAYAAAPSTTYSVHALMTGRYASQGEFSRVGAFNVPVEDRSPRVASILGEAGFETAAMVFHHRFDPRLGLVQGFDEVWTAEPRAEVIRGVAGQATVERARAWLSDRTGKWFLWVHMYDPHEPYLAHAGITAGNSARERYGGEVVYTDERLAELLESLPDLDRTAIVLTGDHGEAFGEHGERLHGASLFEEQVRVPLWVCPPAGRTPPADVGPVSAVDVAPTLLAFAGVERDAGMFGRQLLEPGAAPVFAETAGSSTPMTMVVDWPLKLLHYPQSDLMLLFDLVQDPGERRDLGELEPEKLDHMRTLLDQFLAWRGPESPSLRAH